MSYLRSVLNGQKGAFKNSEVRKVKVPRFKQLTLDKVLNVCIGDGDLMRYLPALPDNGEPPCDRDFLFTIVNTLKPEYFPS